MSHDEQGTHCAGRNCTRAARDTAEQPLPDDWIRTYDGAVDDGPTGLLCPDCAGDDEIREYMARMAEVDELVVQTIRDELVDEQHGRPAGGRATDAMMGD